MGASFSYIVVGAGTAGCVIARRLSDDPSNQVLLLEGGPAEQPPEVDLPSKWFGLSGSEIDWCFTSTPQSAADHRALPIPRGKTLGGSSTINAMVHHRGSAQDYDRWDDLGARGWTAERLTPLLSKLETWRGELNPQRGADGPVIVTPVDQPTPAALRFLAGADQAGHGRKADLNVDPGPGAALNQLAFDGAHRMSSYRAYIVPVIPRPNLTILTRAQVMGLMLRRSRCTGVRYRMAGEVVEASAERDVVLCAGAIQSPQLLLLSGVGPADDLRALGVRPMVDAPGVGLNLHEHVIFPGLSIDSRSSFPRSQRMGTDAVLYARSHLSAGPRDIMINLGSDGFMGPGLESVTAGVKTSFAHMKPKSRGRIDLTSADPFSAPRIDLNVLSHPDDLAGARDALTICRAILNGPAFADVHVREVNPGPGVRSKSEIDAYLRRTGLTFGHSVGTCRMGVDPAAVVDPDLRVYGLDNLRVADASVIPEIPSSPTNATVLALAERASDLILDAAR